MKKFYRPLSLFFAVAVSVLIFVFRNNFSNLIGYGLTGLFIFSVIGNATVFLPAPVILTAFVAGAIFHPFLVALVISVGAAIGEITGYLAGYGGELIIQKDIRMLRARKWVEKFGLWAVFILAVIPNPFFDLAGIVAGATETPLYKFFIVVWVGKFIKFGTIAYLGANSIMLLSKFISI